ncbi:GRAS family protein [Melittangium boletus]|uniref:GAI protein2C n=1 Tax=Melittangium boletus DSM 14713 TaxID=1294270 RepID=A0A250I734_9BACT|nr:GRAS family protein [Melittangium boletus]ATB27674.1 GAI protein2C [Melittangium boletus DSM 14713]
MSREDRAAIKRFFGREVDDIVGTVDESARCERHETALSWQERLRRAGFVPLEALERARPQAVHPAVSLRRERGCVGITYREGNTGGGAGRPAGGDGWMKHEPPGPGRGMAWPGRNVHDKRGNGHAGGRGAAALP